MTKNKTAAKTPKPEGRGAQKNSTTKKGSATGRVSPGIPRAPEHQYFVLLDGRRLGDIKELADALEDMADHIWSHHVNESKNDFATWIQDVFAEHELANRLRDGSGKHHAQIILYREILRRI
jgi:hypothetical protein